ncbi:hypothetical protein BC829DRAFT_404841 [Chytridium lagenaria]|nr:hypothetical protein BC829DRAFT_404841 [Chytridium lagenaria]
MSGSEIFDTYEQEYSTLYDSITKRINNAIPSASGEQRTLFINQTKRELEEADEIISQMELEVLTMVGPSKSVLSRRVKEFKKKTKRLKRDLTRPSAANDRDLLLGGGSSSSLIDLESATLDQRGRLLMGTERLQDGSRRLDNAKRLAFRGCTLNDLNSQREQIVRTRDTLNNADTWVTRSQGVLRGMQRQLQANRLITYGIIAVLILMIIAVIWLKFFS